MSSPSPDERAAWRAAHTEYKNWGWCVTCEQNWPCPTVRLLDAVDTLEGETQAAVDTVEDLRMVLDAVREENDALRAQLGEVQGQAEALRDELRFQVSQIRELGHSWGPNMKAVIAEQAEKSAQRLLGGAVQEPHEWAEVKARAATLHGHTMDIIVRRDGKEYRQEGEWLRDAVLQMPPPPVVPRSRLDPARLAEACDALEGILKEIRRHPKIEWDGAIVMAALGAVQSGRAALREVLDG